MGITVVVVWVFLFMWIESTVSMGIMGEVSFTLETGGI